MLLAIDTSHGMSIAVVDRDGGILAETSSPEFPKSVADLGAYARDVLAEASTVATELSGVAVGIGPGLANHIDVGMAFAHGFASALGKPVVRVHSHDAAMLDRTRPAVVMTETPGGAVAWTAYSAPDPELGLPTRITETVATERNRAVPQAAGTVNYEQVEISSVSAGQLGMLAERLFAGSRPFARKEPLYVETLSAPQPG